MPLPTPSPLAAHWKLDPDVVYLNHGSYGATPTAVLDAQSRYRARLESEPVKWFSHDHDHLMDQARQTLAAFVGADPLDLVFIQNATTAVATVLADYPFKDGDEVLVDSHEYLACMNNLRRRASASTLTINTVQFPPFPISSAKQVVDAILAGLTPRTRLAMISHVTSPSGILLPIEEITKTLASRGVDVLIDGAHGVGFVPLDLRKLESLGITYYTSNCHKWLCAPKGSAFLYARRDRQKSLRPLALSNFAESGKPDRSFFHTEFDYVGTSDTTMYLAVKDAIETVGAMHPKGWSGIMQANHDLVLAGRTLVARKLGTPHAAPDELLGSLAAVLLPEHAPDVMACLAKKWAASGDPLGANLNQRHHIQIPLIHSTHPATVGQRWVRLSAQLYNSMEQYEYLANALVEELGRERDCQ